MRCTKARLNALRHIDYSNRLPRGRSYASSGAVLILEIASYDPQLCQELWENAGAL